ncbi:MAG: hypothetical protein ACR2PL_03910 [Dehalococcoidia bacterium]
MTPVGIVAGPSGNLYVVDLGNNRIRKITPGGVVSALAGSGEQGSLDGPGSSAQFAGQGAIAADNAGNLFVTSFGDHRIRKIAPNGIVSTLPDQGEPSLLPLTIAVDIAGSLYITDNSNNRICRSSPTRSK